jgi:hypothetical protein
MRISHGKLLPCLVVLFWGVLAPYLLKPLYATLLGEYSVFTMYFVGSSIAAG